jgi:ATP-dependent RNA helicase MSS116, mitochondrial
MYSFLTTTQTIAYLLPCIQRIIRSQVVAESALGVQPGRDVCIAIVAPTRELAEQISSQAKALVTFQHGWTVQTFTGSTTLSRDKASLVHQQHIPTIIVATPGRLVDLLQTGKGTPTRIGRNSNRLLVDVIAKTPIVVLDEADLLLQAFRSETFKILSYFPRAEKRQTLLYSATVPTSMERLLSSPEGKNILRPEFVRVDCVGGGPTTKQTNQRVAQSFALLPDMKLYLKGILAILQEAIQDDTCAKVIVFFPTAKLVKFVAEAIQMTLSKRTIGATRRFQVLSIHSRMSHGARSRASSQFRSTDKSMCTILLTSDVSARGVDYDDVSLVVQVSTLSRNIP